MAPDPIDKVGPDPSQLYASPDQRARDGAGRWGHRLADGDEVSLSADATALAGGAAGASRPPDTVGSWLGRWIDRLRAALVRAVMGWRRVPPLTPARPDPPPPSVSPRLREVSEAERRVHERFDSVDCTVRIDSTVYRVLDVSLGGFTFGPDRGHLIANQRFYFELRFPGDHPAPPVRADGTVVRVNNGVIAAKFFLPLSATKRLISDFVAHNRANNRDIPADPSEG